MRKRYTRKYRHWRPRFKWSAKDEVLLIAFERDWQGGRRILKRRKQGRDGGPDSGTSDWDRQDS
jgi:hypothetical protein